MKWIALLAVGGAVFAFCYQSFAKFSDWLKFQSIGTRDYIVDRLSQMYIEVPQEKILLGLSLLSGGMGLLVLIAFLPHLFPGIPFALLVSFVVWKAPKPIVDWLYHRRVDKLTFQMVDALNLMSNGMKSGLSVVQSLGLVTQEMPKPIQEEFSLVLSENKLGVSLEDAFNNLAKRIKSDDVEMFVTSINILKETGGNLAETFDTIASTIRERIKVQKKIAALTAQGFYQGVFVMMIPFALGIVFYQTDPDFMSPLFTTSIGWIIIMVILMLELLGFFVIMKIIRIDV